MRRVFVATGLGDSLRYGVVSLEADTETPIAIEDLFSWRNRFLPKLRRCVEIDGVVDNGFPFAVNKRGSKD